MSEQNQEQYDTMLKYAASVSKALNDANVVPLDNRLCALMVVVGTPEPEGEVPEDFDPAPVGCSVNYDKERGEWFGLDSAEFQREGEAH